MAKRTNGSTVAPGRSRNGNEPSTDAGNDRPALSIKTNDSGQIFSHIRQKWLAETPEERVRQAYVVTLYNEYGFNLEQMDEELHVAGRGSARARTDLVIFNNPSLAYVREFCEDRARILAVVSLPQETFYSSGASVKASLLFLQRFTAKEQADLDKKQAAAKAEVEAKYADEIAAETARLEAAIDAAKEAHDVDARKVAQGELRDYLKRMDDTKTRETRALLKERFDYPIFLYEAEKVGIAATGEPDANELYPNDRMPTGMKPEETCLEVYRRFCKKPEEFALEAQP